MSMAKLKQSFCRTSSSTTVSTEVKLLDVGDEAPDFELKDEDGNVHKLSSFRGRRVILSFFRYASCPLCLYNMCLYNVDRLKQQAALLQKAEIVTLCIFRSTPAMMKRVVDGTSEDTHTLSDRKGSVYNKFQVKRTFKAVITGTMEVAPSTVKKSGKYKAYINYGRIMKDTKGVDGARAALQLPADFLIDENGIIVDLLRATKPQDYMEFERIEAFIPKDKRCRCNKKDCVSPTCRKTYEQIVLGLAYSTTLGHHMVCSSVKNRIILF